MRLLFFALMVTSIFACSDNSARVSGVQVQKDAPNDLGAFFQSYWERRMKLFPLEATQNGDNRYNHLLSLDISEPFRDTLRNFYTSFLTQLGGFDR